MRALLRSLLLASVAATTAAAQRDTTFTWSKRLGDGGRLTIRNINGPIDVRAASGDRAEVRATVRAEYRGNARDVDFDVREHSSTDVEICTVYQGRSVCDRDHSWNNIRVRVTYVVELPKSMRLRVETGNGEVSIVQTVGDVDATSGNGDVTIKESTGRVTASSGNGDVIITSAQGPVRTSTGNGRVEVTAAKGPVEASTGNGDILVKMGSLPADAAPMVFSTGSGNVRVTLPGDFNGEIDASTGNGSVDSDFEVRLTGRLNSSHMRGTIGNGNGPLIKLRSGNGRLVLRKG
ncbi:MAG TPA: DUF4097 family beta strand repeat-containing protein [Gemmatimonadaceae bacterium]